MADKNDIIQRLGAAEELIIKRIDQIDLPAQNRQGTAPVQPVPEDGSEQSDEAQIMQRIGQLEDKVVAHINWLAQPAAVIVEVGETQPEQPAETPQWLKNLTDIEWLTSRIGIGLLLIGVVTLLIWLNDQPWVTDGVRLGTGYGIGAILLGLGLRLSQNRPAFGQVIAGGGIAALYLSTFIGHSTFELIPDMLSLPIVFVTTGLAYGLALWKKQPSMAFVGLIFGLLIPPFLAVDDPSVPIFVGYVCLVLLGVVGIYFTLSWHYLMLAAFSIGWIYMIAFAGSTVNNYEGLVFNDQLAVQLGIFFSFLVFGVLPVVRVVLNRKNLNPAELMVTADEDGKTSQPHAIHWTVFPFIAISPIIDALLTQWLWPDMSAGVWAAIAAGTALIYVVAGIWLGRNERFEVLQIPLFLVGAIVLPMALLKFEGDITAPLLITLSLEAAGLAIFAKLRNLRWMMLATHLLFVWSLFLWMAGILPETIENPFFNLNFLASMIFVVSLGVTAWVQEMGPEKIIYQFMAHLIILPITGFELGEVLDGETYWLLLHIVLHIGVLAAGLFTENKSLRYQGAIFIGLAMLVQSGFDFDSDLTWPNMMLLLAAIQVVGVCASGKLWEDRLLSAAGYAICGAGGFAMVARMLAADLAIPFVDVASLAGLAMLIALLIVSLRYSEKNVDTVIGIVAHLLALLWLAVQTQDFEYTLGAMSALWAVYAIALLLAGMWFDKPLMRNLGIGTVLLTVMKLILIDLENVSTGLRVILFSSFGGVLLVISYFTRNLWRREAELEVVEESPNAPGDA